MKVRINKSTILDGKFVLAGEIEVTSKQKKHLDDGGFLDDISKNTSAMTDSDVQKLIKKVADLESGSNEEIEALKAEVSAKDEEIESLKAELAEALKGDDDLLGAKETKKK